MTAALQERWKSPTSEQQQALGALVWQELRETLVEDLLPLDSIEETVAVLLGQEVARAFWKNLPRTIVLAEAQRLFESTRALEEVLGPEAVAIVRQDLSEPWRPNRELLEQLMDQPLLRQALRNMLQKAIQQFLSQINPLTSSRMPGNRVLGTLGRGIAHRAERAAQMGKTLVGGIGGGLYKQIEEQLQPFLAGFMNRSVRLLADALFEGGQTRLATEARLHGHEVLLKTPLSTLLPKPEESKIDRQLRLAEAVTAHLVTDRDYRESIRRISAALHERMAHRTLGEVLAEYHLPLEPGPPVLRSIGRTCYDILSRPPVTEFLENELKAVW